MNEDRFSRIDALITKEKRLSLFSKNILVIGLGGVGGYALEALIRSGIGKVTIIDFDDINISNINRQIIASKKTIGLKKIDEWEKRIKDIDENIQVTKYDFKLDEKIIESFDFTQFDYVLDCIDDVNAKVAIIKKCQDINIKCISSTGTGKRLDPNKLMITDISKTSEDGLARSLRIKLRKIGINHQTVLFSSEKPLPSDNKVIASLIMVPASAGLLISSYVIRELIK